MDNDGQLVGADREEMESLDQLQSLVHQCGAVDRDLAAHRPVGMTESGLRRSGSDPIGRPSAERSARCGQCNGFNRAGIGTCDGLKDGGMFAIDGQQLCAGPGDLC